MASNVIIRLTQGSAALALGWYVAPRWGFCRFAAVDLVDGVDVVDGESTLGIPCILWL